MPFVITCDKLKKCFKWNKKSEQRFQVNPFLYLNKKFNFKKSNTFFINIFTFWIKNNSFLKSSFIKLVTNSCLKYHLFYFFSLGDFYELLIVSFLQSV